MPPELLALAAVAMYAASQVVTKFATQHGNLFAGFLVSLGTGTVVLGVVAMATTSSWRLPWSAWLLFASAGLAGAGVGRLLMMRAIRDAGASVASPVQASARPIAATSAAVVLLGEEVSAARIGALLLIVAGLWLSARGGTANLVDPIGIGAGVRSGRGSLIRLLSWPVAAGVALATADLLRKSGLLIDGAPVQGAFIGVTAAFLGWLGVLLVRAGRYPLGWPPHFGWYGLHGLLTAAALMLLLSALKIGDLSLVAPIVAAEPVFLILLGSVLLRDHEALRPGTIAGAVVVFAGVGAIGLFDGG